MASDIIRRPKWSAWRGGRGWGGPCRALPRRNVAVTGRGTGAWRSYQERAGRARDIFCRCALDAPVIIMACDDSRKSWRRPPDGSYKSGPRGARPHFWPRGGAAVLGPLSAGRAGWPCAGAAGPVDGSFPPRPRRTPPPNSRRESSIKGEGNDGPHLRALRICGARIRQPP